MPLNKTLPETQSVGQDNIGYIVSALVDFYLHKKEQKIITEVFYVLMK